MATVIKLKRSTTADSVPTTSDLADGEVAINIADQKIYVNNGKFLSSVTHDGKTSKMPKGVGVPPIPRCSIDKIKVLQKRF